MVVKKRAVHDREAGTALSVIGITISASGKLKLDEDKLMETKPAKIGKLFSEDSEFTKKINTWW